MHQGADEHQARHRHARRAPPDIGRRRQRGRSGRRDRRRSRSRRTPPPGHDLVQRRRAPPRAARGDARRRAFATTTSPSAPTSSSPDRSTPTCGSSARTAASSCAGAPRAAAPDLRALHRSVRRGGARRDRRGVPPVVDLASGAPVPAEAGEADAVLRIDEHHEIDLAGRLPRRARADRADAPALPARLPRAVLGVRSEARGRSTHAHGGDDIDPRLAGLAALLVERNGDGHD